MKCNLLGSCKYLKVAKNSLGRIGLKMSAKSPEILLVVGVAGIGIGAVLACRATIKALDVLEETNNLLDKIEEAREIATEETYTNKEYKTDLTVTYAKTAVNVAKLYLPAFAIGALGIAAIIGSHNILKRRNLALVAAYKAVDEAFSKYRSRVVTELGTEKDHDFRYGTTRKIYHEATVNEDGTNSVETITETDVEIPGASDYARIYSKETTREWCNTPEYNLSYILNQENTANDLLHSRGHIFLNEVYDLLGFERTQAGCVVGWVANNDSGDNKVKFGLDKFNQTQYRDFITGRVTGILLDFNVDGVVYDLI